LVRELQSLGLNVELLTSGQVKERENARRAGAADDETKKEAVAKE
jgi:hypothetical protein